MRYLVLALSSLAAPVFADCPDPFLEGARFAATGADLIRPQNWEVRAGGTYAAPCDGWRENGIGDDQISGFLPVAPTAVFDLAGMAPHILMVVAEAVCEPVLAVRSADGVWYFGETANGREEVIVWGAPDGPLQVWIGSTDVDQCPATVTLETFDR